MDNFNLILFFFLKMSLFSSTFSYYLHFLFFLLFKKKEVKLENNMKWTTLI
jgi:hypothetical protein